MKTRLIALTLSGLLIFTGMTSQAVAAVVGTQQALSMEARNVQISVIQAQLARNDVQRAMLQMGVDPGQVQLRIGSLSDTELVQLSEQMETLPAGGDSVLVLVGAVFVVLLILELTGVIDIFKKA